MAVSSTINNGVRSSLMRTGMTIEIVLEISNLAACIAEIVGENEFGNATGSLGSIEEIDTPAMKVTFMT